MNKILLLPALLGATLPALAHEGHGLPGASHWHSTDAWGFVAVGVLVALAVWLSRRDK